MILEVTTVSVDDSVCFSQIVKILCVYWQRKGDLSLRKRTTGDSQASRE